ncbi:MAG TPA: hypothetical protein VGJ25_05185, partial [Gaiellaceae bacterium]
MTRTPQLRRLVTLAALLLPAGLLLGRVELVALAAPLLVLLVAGLPAATAVPSVALGLSSERS